MRFSRSTHLLICLTLTSIIRTGLPILVKLIDLVNSVIILNHQNWLTYSGGTDRPGELCYNFSISNNLTQMVNFSARIPDCDSHSLALLDLFISSDAWRYYLFYNGFLSTGKFWSCYCLSFYWLSIIFTRGGPVSSHCLRLFSCWLGPSSWSFETYSKGGYL